MADNLPDSLDAVVVGTGLVEAIYAAAVARSGRTVLHLDRNEYYGGDWAVFNWQSLQKWVSLHSGGSGDDTECCIAESCLSGQHQQLTDIRKVLSKATVSNVVQYFFIPDTIDEASDTLTQTALQLPQRTGDIDCVLEASTTASGDEKILCDSTDSSGAAASVCGKSAGSYIDSAGQDCCDEMNALKLDRTTASINAATDTPTTATDTPTTATDVPTATDTPTTATDTPTTATDVPITATDVPTTATDVPITATDVPITATDTPITASVSELSTSDWTVDKLRKLSRHFNIELSPKIVYCSGQLVELLISSNTSRYAEFRNITHIVTPLRERLVLVPSSRADVFSARSVSVVEKRLLMKFLSFCVDNEELQGIDAEYAHCPFDEFLRRRHRLTPDLMHYVVHAIAMVTPETSTFTALRSARRFLLSLGRYGNTPFLWPTYGSGELTQCFCRMCAVFGGIYHLSRDVQSVLVASESGDNSESNSNRVRCVGVVSQGRRFNCKRLLLSAQYRINAADSGVERADSSAVGGISRAILLLDAPLQVCDDRDSDGGDNHVMLMRLPAAETNGSVCEPVTLLQLTSTSAAVPQGLVLVHLTCEQRNSAESDLRPVVELLLRYSHKGGSGGQCVRGPPRLLFALYFNRSTDLCLDNSLPDGVAIAPPPDSSICFESAVEKARCLFAEHFPGEEFLPRAPDPDEIIYFDEPEPEVGNKVTLPSDETPSVSPEDTSIDTHVIKDSSAGAESD